MKKLLLGIIVLAVFLMLGTTVLAGSSAPKSICYEQDSGGFQVIMTLKALGKANTADGAVKYYAIHGSALHSGMYPPSAITGTATFINGILRFNHSTIVRSNGEPGSSPENNWKLWTDGSFNPANGTGMLSLTILNIPVASGAVNSESLINYPIVAISCDSLSISTSTIATAMSNSGMAKYGSIFE
jgi:hypothetical protein